MGVYIYTPRSETKKMLDGEQVARVSYAYKDFDAWNAPARWIRSAGAQERFGQKAADKHNANGVKYLAMGDKFEVGASVFRVEEGEQVRFKYYDCDMGGLEHVGELRKRGRKWYIKFKDEFKPEPEAHFEEGLFEA